MSNLYPDLEVWLSTFKLVEQERQKNPSIPEPPPFLILAGWWGKVIYKTQKFCLFEINEELPYQGYEEKYQLVLFDGSLGYIVSSVKLLEDGTFLGHIDNTHIHYPFQAKTPKELVQTYKRINSDYLKTCYGSSRGPLATFIQLR